MRHNFTLAVAVAAIIWSVGGGAASAQTGMGSTSPLGTLSAEPPMSSTSAGIGGIPLGATELSTPGLSQTPCPNTNSNTPFDGGGSTASTACGAGLANGSSDFSSVSGFNGSTSNGSVAGMTGSTVGSGIPLGATDLGTPGESQNVAVPGVSSCTTTQQAGDLSQSIGQSTGMTSATGC